MSHTCKPGHPGILADDCERCKQHAERPLLLDLDGTKMASAWNKMVAVEYDHNGHYTTGNEATACRQLYCLALWLQRYLGIEPFVPFEKLGMATPTALASPEMRAAIDELGRAMEAEHARREGVAT